jgi:anti-anti-sigma factor
MNVTITQEQGLVPVTLIHIHGKLDGSNYKTVIAQAQELYQDGVRNMLVDLAEVDFMSSAGMVALLSIARLLKGHSLEGEEGWSLLHSAKHERKSGLQKQVKLLKPQPRIAQALAIAGFDQVFEIHQDLKQAVASF